MLQLQLNTTQRYCRRRFRCKRVPQEHRAPFLCLENRILEKPYICGSELRLRYIGTQSFRGCKFWHRAFVYIHRALIPRGAELCSKGAAYKITVHRALFFLKKWLLVWHRALYYAVSTQVNMSMYFQFSMQSSRIWIALHYVLFVFPDFNSILKISKKSTLKIFFKNISFLLFFWMFF